MKIIILTIMILLTIPYTTALITVQAMGTPENVTTTLMAGGSLAADTTYFVRVTAKNDGVSYNRLVTSLSSTPSTEINFTTNTTHKSANVSWSAVYNASHYNVYFNTINNTYTNDDRIGTSDNPTTTQTYVSINATSTTNRRTSDTLTNSYAKYPFNLNKRLGTIAVKINETASNLDLEDITAALDAAGYSDYYYYDGYNFGIKGSIYFDTGTVGNLNISYTTIYFIGGGFQNKAYNTSNITLGRYSTTSKVTSAGSVIYIDLATFDLRGINIYDFKIDGAYILYVDSYHSIGHEIAYIGNNIVDCTFYRMRQSGVSYSGNTLKNPTILRTWGDTVIQNRSTYITSIALGFYPRNGINPIWDSTMQIYSASYALSLQGFANTTYPCGNFYDTKFIGVWNWSNLEFQTADYLGFCGVKFHYSINGAIVNSDGEEITNARVTIINNESTVLVNATFNGTLPKQYLPVMWIEPTGNGVGSAYYNKHLYNPFKVIIEAEGYTTYQAFFTINEETSTKFVLSEAGSSTGNEFSYIAINDNALGGLIIR